MTSSNAITYEAIYAKVAATCKQFVEGDNAGGKLLHMRYDIANFLGCGPNAPLFSLAWETVLFREYSLNANTPDGKF